MGNREKDTVHRIPQHMRYGLVLALRGMLSDILSQKGVVK